MTIDYVLLVSSPRKDKLLSAGAGSEIVETLNARIGKLNDSDEDVKAVMKLFVDHKTPTGGNDGDVFVYPAGGTDGGNSGGGDGFKGGTLKARGTFGMKSFWNFRVTAPDTRPQTERFPLEMRYEICTYFNNLREADDFLRDHLEKLRAVFERVQLVAITERN